MRFCYMFYSEFQHYSVILRRFARVFATRRLVIRLGRHLCEQSHTRVKSLRLRHLKHRTLESILAITGPHHESKAAI